MPEAPKLGDQKTGKEQNASKLTKINIKSEDSRPEESPENPYLQSILRRIFSTCFYKHPHEKSIPLLVHSVDLPIWFSARTKQHLVFWRTSRIGFFIRNPRGYLQQRLKQFRRKCSTTRCFRKLIVLYQWWRFSNFCRRHLE
jgi:hypothetical protein